ncbi:Inner membrane protein YidH [Propionicimonas sp. T2.31MG-18]|uniref:YidH family protein n=1 Tax=Propionicimonas sp. T2.31MG-18 TaxID=3157620 RepID=UPI0035EB7297
MSHNRFPRGVYARGTDPDARFSLANERTFLAWISAGLALVSVGVGVASLGVGLNPVFRAPAAVVLVLGGIACPVQAWFGWVRVETALREGRRLPFPPLVALLSVVVAVAGALVLLGLLVP